MKRLAVTSIAVASFALAVGCGTSNPASGAKSRYIEQGDVICRDALSKISGVGNGTDTATLEKARDIWNDAYKKINALAKPDDDFEGANAFDADMHNLALTSEAPVQASIVAGQEQKVKQRLNDLAAARERAAKTAKDFGFKTCSQL